VFREKEARFPLPCPFMKHNEDSMAKILIAEDERDIRDLVAFTLRFAGYEVFTAANGEEAVELAPNINPDLILMDVRMPRMTGYEACRIMKLNPDLKDIPIVFLSAKGQETEIQQGLEAGAEEYLLKPFAPDQLTSHVKTILAKFGK
jgi:two-component system alkaline phosphatase synthesis response regulator PhoP